MWGFLIVAIALLGGLVILPAAVPGLGFLGVPIALVALAVVGGVALNRRRTAEGRMRDFRTQGEKAGPESGPDVDFTARDQNTLS